MRRRLTEARIGRLATVRPDGGPHVVVCCFALAGATAYTAIDHKPKSTDRLQRLRNLEANPGFSLLADLYDEDWSTLWWVRVDGIGRIVEGGAEHGRGLEALCAKYRQYRSQRPTGPVLALDIASWRSWP